jgi:hypothetical protein
MAMSIAEHHPEELYAKNKGLAKMSKSKLHEFTNTKEKGLPEHVAVKNAKKRLKKIYG